jgi:hypothetical protein
MRVRLTLSLLALLVTVAVAAHTTSAANNGSTSTQCTETDRVSIGGKTIDYTVSIPSAQKGGIANPVRIDVVMPAGYPTSSVVSSTANGCVSRSINFASGSGSWRAGGSNTIQFKTLVRASSVFAVSGKAVSAGGTTSGSGNTNTTFTVKHTLK